MSPRNKNQPCFGTNGEGCPGLPSYIYQPYPNQPERRICGVHAEAVRKHYVRSKRLRKLLATVLRPIPEVMGETDASAAMKNGAVAKDAPVEIAVETDQPAKRPGRTGRSPGRPRKAQAERQAVPA